MTFADRLPGWSESYQQWLDRARPLLEAAQWGDAFAGYPWVQPTDIPFTVPTRPLAASRLAVVTTGGFFLKGEQTPFTAENIEGDLTFRVLPATAQPADLAIAHTHYPHDAALADLGTVLPLDHLHAMVDQGRIGSLGPVYSISGYITNVAEFCERSVEAIIRHVQEAGCDAALLVPV